MTNRINKVIKVATRKSPLAMAQTKMVIKTCENLFPNLNFEIVAIASQGDKDLNRPLHGFSQVGIFVKELETALINHDADCAIHCLKDLPAPIDERFSLPCYLPREEVDDVLLYLKTLPWEKIKKVATGSMRRKIFLSKVYPAWEFEELRGNINTRITKLIDGESDAIVLALAGLNRLKGVNEENIFKGQLEKLKIFNFPFVNIIPAPSQGCLVVECLKTNQPIKKLMSQLNHPPTQIAVELERRVMQILEGSCRSPLGCLASIEDKEIVVAVMMERNGNILKSTRRAKIGEHQYLPEQLGKDLLK